MVIDSNLTIRKNRKFLLRVVFACQIFTLSACFETTKREPEIAPAPVPVEEKIEYSATPIKKPSGQEIYFAQSALKKLGYNIGIIDGIWGPRSAQAIQAFEQAEELYSAEGFLSALNIHRLSQLSGLQVEDSLPKKRIVKKTKSPQSIVAQLDDEMPLSQGAQLVIVERPYSIYSKPNPFSAKIDTIEPGTGVYVISRQEGFYKVESFKRMVGYIQAD